MPAGYSRPKIGKPQTDARGDEDLHSIPARTDRFDWSEGAGGAGSDGGGGVAGQDGRHHASPGAVANLSRHTADAYLPSGVSFAQPGLEREAPGMGRHATSDEPSGNGDQRK